MLSKDDVQQLAFAIFPNNAFLAEETEFGLRCSLRKEVNGKICTYSYYVNMEELGFNENIFKKTVLKLLERALRAEGETVNAE